MLTFQPVTSFKDFEAVRRIYNESLEYMTKPLKPNTLEEQIDWWFKTQPCVYVVKDGLDAVGFVKLTFRDTRYQTYTTPMFAIAKEFQGLGYAREIIKFYLKAAPGPLVGEQLKSNEIIRRLNAEAGWEIIREHAGVEYLHHPGLKKETRHQL